MKRILITGENSYIGTSFTKWMEQYPGETEIEEISLQNQESKEKDFRGYDSILHVAAIVHKKETKDMEQLYHEVNCNLAVAVAKKAKESGVGQFIFLSTAAVYGSRTQRITIDTKLEPCTYYGREKLQAEKEISKLEEASFRVAIVRPPMIYGPDCKGNFPRLVKLAKKLPLFPKIENKRSMLYIDHLSEFLRIIIRQEAKGYYHPQDMEYVETSELVGLIKVALGKKMRFTKSFNCLVKPMAKRVGSVEKLFGDCYYDKSLTDAADIKRVTYCLTKREDCIKKSLGRIDK